MKAHDTRIKTRQRVLIADDDANFARRLSDYLWDHGCEARVARTISASKELIEYWHPEVVFVDHMLPETNALALLKFISHRNPHKKPPKVIVMSRQTLPQGIEQVRRAGAARYLVKPFSFEEAFHTIGERRADGPEALKEPPASIKELHLINLFLKQATQKDGGGDRLYNLMRMINLKVDGLRTSLIHCVNDQTAVVLASNDDEHVQGLPLALPKYPEIQAVRQTRSTVVIPNVRADLKLAHTQISHTPFSTLVVFPVYRDSAFYGVLSVRLKRKDPSEIFYVEKFGQVCSQILSLAI